MVFGKEAVVGGPSNSPEIGKKGGYCFDASEIDISKRCSE